MVEGVGVEQGGITVVEPGAVVGAPGLACCIAASRVAISAGEAVGSSVNGEANTGELKVVEVLPPLPISVVAHGFTDVGDGDADMGEGEIGVDVGANRGGGVAAGAQAVTLDKQTQTANVMAGLKRMMSLPGLLLELLHIISRFK
jgi:hypothetical protein